MSIRNARTGRHEDDLMNLAARNEGKVPLTEVIEHLEQIVALPGVHGENVSRAARTAALQLRLAGMRGQVDLYAEVDLLG